MKKIIIALLAIALCLGLFACDNSGEDANQTTAAPTEAATLAPDNDPTLSPADEPTISPTPAPTASPEDLFTADFLANFDGTWSEKTDEYGGKMLSVSEGGTKISFMIRNAGGYFPGGTISNLAFSSKDTVTFTVAVPESSYYEGDEQIKTDAYELHASVKVIDTRTIELTCAEEAGYNKTYVRDLTQDEFLSKYKGTYTVFDGDNKGLFIYFDEAEKAALFANWNSDNFQSGPISEFMTEGYNRFYFTINVPEVKTEEAEISAYSVYVSLKISDDKTLIIEKCTDNCCACINGSFVYDERYQFPNPAEDFIVNETK